MRVLLTGGAGFIGTHVLARLRAAGHDVVVLDSLRPDVHRGAAAGIAGLGARRRARRRRRSTARCRASTPSCHLAAKVGLGVDVQDLPDYADSNDLGTAVLLAAMARAGVGRLVLASSMVVYGEGLGRCAEHGAVPPGPRREADLAAGRFEPPCPVLRRAAGARRSSARTRRSTRATPTPRPSWRRSSSRRRWARATGGSVGRAALPQRLRPGPAARHPLRRGRRDLPVGAAARARRRRCYEDGGQRRDFVHVRDVAAATVRGRSSSTTAACGRTTSARARRARCGDMAAALAAAVGGPAPVVTGRYRLGDVRHITADSARCARELGWAPQVPFADGRGRARALTRLSAAARVTGSSTRNRQPSRCSRRRRCRRAPRRCRA